MSFLQAASLSGNEMLNALPSDRHDEAEPNSLPHDVSSVDPASVDVGTLQTAALSATAKLEAMLARGRKLQEHIERKGQSFVAMFSLFSAKLNYSLRTGTSRRFECWLVILFQT